MLQEDEREYLYRTFFRWIAVSVVLGLAITATCAVLSVGSDIRLAAIAVQIFGTFALTMIVAARHQH